MSRAAAVAELPVGDLRHAAIAGAGGGGALPRVSPGVVVPRYRAVLVTAAHYALMPPFTLASFLQRDVVKALGMVALAPNFLAASFQTPLLT